MPFLFSSKASQSFSDKLFLKQILLFYGFSVFFNEKNMPEENKQKKNL